MNCSFNWDLLPSTRLEAARLSTPIGCLIQKTSDSVPTIEAFPLKCSTCKAFTNKHTVIDQKTKKFTCVFCRRRTVIPEDSKSSELHASGDLSSCETIDYILPRDISSPIASRGPVVLYAIDLYQHVECPNEFEALKRHACASLSQLTEDTSVGLITFADSVFLSGKNQDLAFSVARLFPEGYDVANVLGDKPMLAKLLSKIAEGSSNNIWKGQNLLRSGYFTSPAEALEKVQNLRLVATRSFKPERATGLALLIASLLLSSPNASSLLGKIKLFASGPCTYGPGMVVRTSETLRAHIDIADLRAHHFVNASKFYRALSYIGCGYTVQHAYEASFTLRGSLTDHNVSSTAPKFSFDLYFGALDQVGLYEMCSLSSSTGGSIIFNDRFDSHYFARKLAADNLIPNEQDCILTVVTSTGLKVINFPCHGTAYQPSYHTRDLQKFHHERISDTITKFESSLSKRYFTNKWYFGDLRNSVGCVLLEVDPPALKLAKMASVYIQFQLKFWDNRKQRTVVRTTTLIKSTTKSEFTSESGSSKITSAVSDIARQRALLSSFNAETWITILTRLLIRKIDTTLGYESFEDVINLTDHALMRIAKIFGVFKEETTASNNPFENLKALYSIDAHFKKLPTLAYYLRKNLQLVSIFNSSPDETALYHHLFFGLSAGESCLMIQPKLYEVDEQTLIERKFETTTILNCTDRRFFVMDSLHTIVIYLHTTKDKLQLHSSDNDDIVYERKIEEVNRIIDLVESKLTSKRSIVPRLVLTQTGHSQARFLLSRLSPPNNIIEDGMKTKKKWWRFNKESPYITTDDISEEKYCEEVLSRAQRLRIDEDV